MAQVKHNLHPSQKCYLKHNAYSEIYNFADKPMCIFTVGPYESGKTTLVNKIVSQCYMKGFPFVINLDAGCDKLPYPVNIDIRDQINYKQVMQEFNMNKKHSLMTSLNIFSTKMDEVIGYIGVDGERHDYIIVDAPGLKEIFEWWSCGTRITRAFASKYQTLIVYVMDSNKCTDPHQFWSDMMHLNSIRQAVNLPILVVMNKIDLMDHNYALDWMYDAELFWSAFYSASYHDVDIAFETVEAIFHQVSRNVRFCGLSAATGEGITLFFRDLHMMLGTKNLSYPEVCWALTGEISPSGSNDKSDDAEMIIEDDKSEEIKTRMSCEKELLCRLIDAVVNTESFHIALHFYKFFLQSNGVSPDDL